MPFTTRCGNVEAMVEGPPPLPAQPARRAIDGLYRVFAAPSPLVIEGCPCCIGKRNVDVLLTTPLDQLSGKMLWSYVSGVFLTVGGERDFKYLLPRIFEISVADLADANDPEIILGKLSLAHWRSWPADQQVAVEAAIDSWIDLALARDLVDAADGFVGWEMESVLCGAARAGMSLDRWIDRLRIPAAAPVIADMKHRFPDDLSSFWELTPEGRDRLGTLLASLG